MDNIADFPGLDSLKESDIKSSISDKLSSELKNVTMRGERWRNSVTGPAVVSLS